MTPGELRRLYFIIHTFLSYGLDELIPKMRITLPLRIWRRMLFWMPNRHKGQPLGERLRLPELHDAPSDCRRRRGYLELRRHEKRYDDGRGRGLVPPGDHGEPAILPEAIRPASLEATLSLRPVHPLSGK